MKPKPDLSKPLGPITADQIAALAEKGIFLQELTVRRTPLGLIIEVVIRPETVH